jgi:2-C-methyl-D-erythritol 4-phosphate cytidylyltransferase
MKIAVILAAAGTSSRLGMDIKKEFIKMHSLLFPTQIGGTVLSTAAEAFFVAINKKSDFTFPRLIITTNANFFADTKKALLESDFVKEQIEKQHTELELVEGGKTRQESVFNALKALENDPPDIVLIHDAARPWVDVELITEVIDSVVTFEAAVPAVPAVDTQKEVSEEGIIVRHLQRRHIAAVQTPQGFMYDKLLEGHKKASLDGNVYTDDTEIWGKYCGDVKITTGSTDNIKITFKNDIEKIAGE